ncbi:MAG: hypothetical protein U1B78_04605, partial [Dehalococcoidia bacterium]|nr:hypothetical protein [Dehalococcoidia bacterium]
MAHQANYEPGYGRVWHVRVGDWLHEAARSAIGPADEKAQRQDVLRRTVLAPVIIAIVPIEQFHFAGWPAIVSACSAALLYNLLLGYLVFVKKQAFAARLLAFVFDAALLSVASVFVLRALGAANSSSDIWLAFLVFVVSGGFTLAPAGSLIYTSLAMGWFTFGTLMFFPPESQFREELLVRLVFFATFGLVSLGMASELQKRRTRLEQQNRQTIGMLATLVEARDTDAGAHLHR